MNKEKILLIAGCSNAAGFEISGVDDCTYNREHSFGNLLADKMEYKAINIAMGAASNSAIARSILLWFKANYDPDTQDVRVLVAWTESCRLDVPYEPPMDYHNPAIDWYTADSRNFMQVNPGMTGMNINNELITVTQAQEFMAFFGDYMEISAANSVLQLQYFFQANNVNYLMCNTMHMFSHSVWTNVYFGLIDATNYMDMWDNDLSFYHYYKEQGYENPLAKYWHHGEEPHRLYAEKLYTYWITVCT